MYNLSELVLFLQSNNKQKNTTMKTTEIWDEIKRRRLDVIVTGFHYSLIDGTPLFRIETKGRTGKTLYANIYYLDANGKQLRVHGMDGATGRGWGGMVAGYATKEEIQSKSNIKL